MKLKGSVTRMCMGWVVSVGLFFLGTAAVTQGPYMLLEEQLAGVKLGARFLDYDENGRLKPTCLYAIYGMPDYIVGITFTQPTTTLPGVGTPGAPGAPGGPMMPSGPGRPGGPMMPGGPGFMGAPGMGSGFGGQPTMPGVMAGVSGIATLAGSPMAVPRTPSVPQRPMTPSGPPTGETGAPTGAGTEGPPGVGGVGGGGVLRVWPIPNELAWAIPPFVSIDATKECHFIYRRQRAHLSFLMRLEEAPEGNYWTVIGITVAGRKYDGARTAKGNPFKSIKLGDSLERVLNRYGRPTEIVYYDPFTLAVIASPTRNMVFRYYSSSGRFYENVEFTFLNDKVVRIFIFDPLRANIVKPVLPERTR